MTTLLKVIPWRHAIFAVAIPILLIGGCIVGDQLTTLTIHPDGSADLVVFRSNLRSTEKGARAQKELADYKANFESRTEPDFVRIQEAGGEVVQLSWIRQEAPFSNYVHSHFPNSDALEKYFTEKDKDGTSPITTRIVRDGSLRRLTVKLAVPPEKTDSSTTPSADVEQLRQALADGISETRIAVTNGSITATRGFTVAKDKQSALLNSVEMDELLRTGRGNAELYLEWEVNPR